MTSRPPASYRCACCKGAAHPASGCQHSERVIVCGPCTRKAWRWIIAHTRGRKGRPDFYGSILDSPPVAQNNGSAVR